MKILQVVTGTGLGGAERQVVWLARALAHRGHTVRIVSLIPVGQAGDDAAKSGIPVTSLGMRRGRPDPRGLLRLAALVRHWGPTLVHSHMVHANLLARVAVSLSHGVVNISTIHSLRNWSPALCFAYRMTDRFAYVTTGVSFEIAQRTKELALVSPSRLRMVPNGVDTDQFSPDRAAGEGIRAAAQLDTDFVWIAVGRFEAVKDYPTMLQAFALVLQQHPRATLMAVGQGPLWEEMKAAARSLGVHERVHFCGLRQDIPSMLRMADAYVLSSKAEGLPVALLEACSSALPVVATRVGGNPQIVRPGESGVLVPPEDPCSLARAMLEVLALRTSAREEMGQQGRARIMAEYSLGSVVDGWEGLYREAVESREMQDRGNATAGS